MDMLNFFIYTNYLNFAICYILSFCVQSYFLLPVSFFLLCITSYSIDFTYFSTLIYHKFFIEQRLGDYIYTYSTYFPMLNTDVIFYRDIKYYIVYHYVYNK